MDKNIFEFANNNQTKALQIAKALLKLYNQVIYNKSSVRLTFQFREEL